MDIVRGDKKNVIGPILLFSFCAAPMELFWRPYGTTKVSSLRDYKVASLSGLQRWRSYGTTRWRPYGTTKVTSLRDYKATLVLA